MLFVATVTQRTEAQSPVDSPVDPDCCKQVRHNNISGNERGAAVELGLFKAAARGEIDYSTLADAQEGPIFADLPEGSFLPINAVFALHKSNPELFAWCG